MATYRIGDVLECVCLTPFGWKQREIGSVNFEKGETFFIFVDTPEGGTRSFKQIFRLLEGEEGSLRKTDFYLTPLPFKDLRLDKKLKVVKIL